MDDNEYKHLRGPRGDMLWCVLVAALVTTVNLAIILIFVGSLIKMKP